MFDANIVNPDQTSRPAASDPGLHYLPNNLLGVSRLNLIKHVLAFFCQICLNFHFSAIWPKHVYLMQE